MVRFNNIKAMIYQIKLYKHEKLDEKIMIILDKINLRTYSRLIIYELGNYKIFTSILNENLYEIKVYDFVIKHYVGFKEEMLFMPVREFEFFPNFPELITLGSLIKHDRDERLLLNFRIIYLILENKSRKELIKTVILFMIKLSFMTPKKRTKYLDFISTETIDMQQRYAQLCS